MIKGYELDGCNPLRKYKGRVVFRGNQVWTSGERGDVPVFEESSCNPADIMGSKSADAWGSLPGHSIQQADAESAYTQAPFSGMTDTYVRLPENRWPSWWKEKFPNLKNPVCRLRRALYGHPEAGAYWEQH